MASAAEREKLRKVLNFDRYNAHTIPDGFDCRTTRHSHPYAFYSDKPIEKSENDKRDYRLVRLDNGLEIMLCSDRDADRAAACMSIRVGSMHDPPSLPGLAHYCEHLLFCGSKKYPNESDYDEFVSKHGGSYNAFTGLEFTNYTFNIQPDYIGGALDRFAHIFINPLFEASVSERELKAVDSEFQQHLQSDGWREDALRSHLSKKGHPFGKFSSGNAETLKVNAQKQNLDCREEVVKFYKEYYSANIMRLCVVSNQCLDTLTEMCAGLFADVPNSNREPTIWPGNPMPDDQTQTWIQRVRERNVVSIVFPLADQSQFYRTQPANFLANLIGHESKGSVLSLLKEKDWATGITAGLESSATGWSSFSVSVNLTESGKPFAHSVVLAVFAYLQLLRHQKSLESHFNEYAVMDAIHFRFREVGEPDDTADLVAQNMHEPFHPSKILSQSAVADVYDHELIKATLDQLKGDNFSLFFSSKELVEGIKYDGTEPYYGVKFGQQLLDEHFVNACLNPPKMTGLHLPDPNHFIPHGLTFDKSVKVEDAEPAILVEDECKRIWYKRDALFNVPKSQLCFVFRNPSVTESARAALCIRLFTGLVEESLNEVHYQCNEAGLGFSLDLDELGISLLVEGYSPGILELVHRIATCISQIQPTDAVFKRIKEVVTRGLKNWSKSNATAKASTLLSRALSPIYFTQEERLKEIESISLDEVLARGKEALGSYFLEAYTHGDFAPEDALNASAIFQDAIPSMTPCLHPPKTFKYALKRGTQAVIQGWAENREEVDNAVINYYCAGFTEDRDLAMTLATLTACLEQRCFDELRTKQQLGYSVVLGQKTAGGVTGLVIQVTSETLPDQVDDAVEAFVADSLTFLQEMTQEAFEEYRQSLVDILREKFKTMGEESGYNWNAIDSGRLAFKLFEDDAMRVSKVQKDEIIGMHKRIFLDSEQRAKLSIQVRSQRLQPKDFRDDILQCIKACGKEQTPELDAFLDSKPALDDIIKLTGPIPSLNAICDFKMPKQGDLISDFQLFQKTHCITPPPVKPYGIL